MSDWPWATTATINATTTTTITPNTTNTTTSNTTPFYIVNIIILIILLLIIITTKIMKRFKNTFTDTNSTRKYIPEPHTKDEVILEIKKENEKVDDDIILRYSYLLSGSECRSLSFSEF